MKNITKIFAECDNSVIYYIDKVNNNYLLTVYDEILHCTIETSGYKDVNNAYKRIDLFKTQYS